VVDRTSWEAGYRTLMETSRRDDSEETHHIVERATAARDAA
jgi:hypothetical protein